MLATLLFLIHIVCQVVTLPFSCLIFRLWDAAVRYSWWKPELITDTLKRFVILVPAHNEAVSIQATLQSLLALNYPKSQFELLVIADNCTDSTAQRAQEAGATVLERFHESQKSKGFALEYALQYLQKRDILPEAIVIIDADTQVDTELLRAFDRRLRSGQDWIQAYYTVSNPDDSWRTQLMTFAFAHFNAVWLSGQDALGFGCALRGNGMAFSWAGLVRCPWKAYGLAEDLEFSWKLRLAGEKVCFAAEVKVYGEMIQGNAVAAASQRLRWEHGRRQLRQTFSRQIIQSSWSDTRKLIALVDLYMPALAAYVMRLSATLATALALFSLRSTPFGDEFTGFLLGLSLFQLLNFLIYLLTPFFLVNLPLRYLKVFVVGPLYIIWKASLLLRRAPVEWIRAVRKQ